LQQRDTELDGPISTTLMNNTHTQAAADNVSAKSFRSRLIFGECVLCVLDSKDHNGAELNAAI
jgi:hypothetical protein